MAKYNVFACVYAWGVAVKSKIESSMSPVTTRMYNRVVGVGEES